ncbi:MAG TPA: hypothetical protein VHL56_07985 [Candidatus Limnocylindrales bacterium]|nr:hypothetical protein [Candidatus Limnocylindrales bacterium]
MTKPRGARRTPVTSLLILGLLGLVPIACSSPATPTATPAATQAPGASGAPASNGPGPTPVPAITPAPTIDVVPTSPGQSQTSWGLIWNGVPDWFPVPIDAATADPDHGPVSGAWSVPTADVAPIALAGLYRDALVENGWLANVDGPLEDGSYTIASIAAGNCQTLTTITPRGADSLVTVLYGASCIFE